MRKRGQESSAGVEEGEEAFLAEVICGSDEDQE